MIVFEWLTADTVDASIPELAVLLIDAIESGASIGYMLPYDPAEIHAYCHGVANAVKNGSKWLLVARLGDGTLVGTAQLEPASKANGRHRAEVQKVIVTSRLRKHGIGTKLMAEVEAHARSKQRTLLLLDTRAHDAGERLYSACGWTRFGVVPDYAYSPDGSIEGTAFYYKQLG
ncbi:MAG: histone acetyltransferase and related acetyltransferase [Chloroflexota bacterium]|jgi:GNAT superfamily N-acetyltransferase